jgi:hypothetical protein
MENMNKIISFILGLIVVIVFIAVISGRLKLGEKVASLTKSGTATKTTPTPTPVTTANNVTTTNRYATNTTTTTNTTTKGGNTVQGVNSIPNTGAETALIPTALSMFGAGMFLRKAGKKKNS